MFTTLSNLSIYTRGERRRRNRVTPDMNRPLRGIMACSKCMSMTSALHYVVIQRMDVDRFEFKVSPCLLVRDRNRLATASEHVIKDLCSGCVSRVRDEFDARNG